MCAFRKRCLPQIEALFVQVLNIARQMKLLKLGTIALDGAKLHANASRHSALSYGLPKRLRHSSKPRSKHCWRARRRPISSRCPPT